MRNKLPKQFQSDKRWTQPRGQVTDIDDTITDDGQLHADAYEILWKLKKSGFKIIPVTGRPAGWCEMIARFWPVEGIVGENGGFYFRYHKKKMKRVFFASESQRKTNRKKLDKIEKEVLKKVPGSALASDQFCRLMDLAIDFCEDVKPLSEKKVQQIVQIFEKHGAQAKVSSIHVNGWFGKYNKVTMLKKLLKKEFDLNEKQTRELCLFSGDSPNDEPMFAYFPYSVGVANIAKFLPQLKNPPQFITPSKGGLGFVELGQHLLRLKQSL
jgi:HAD superfamily hydrolase (TIGR01484 family)